MVMADMIDGIHIPESTCHVKRLWSGSFVLCAPYTNVEFGFMICVKISEYQNVLKIFGSVS